MSSYRGTFVFGLIGLATSVVAALFFANDCPVTGAVWTAFAVASWTICGFALRFEREQRKFARLVAGLRAEDVARKLVDDFERDVVVNMTPEDRASFGRFLKMTKAERAAMRAPGAKQ